MLKTIGLIVYVSSGVVAFGLFGGGVLLGLTRILGPGVAFGMFVMGMLLGIIVLFAGFVDAANNGFSTRSITLVLGLIPTCALVYFLVSGKDYPMINDVTTDVVFPPEFVHARGVDANVDRNMGFPLEFRVEVESFYSDLVPQPKLTTVDDAYIQALDIVSGISSWEVTSKRIGGKESYIEGTVTSGAFGFVDDFVIRITGANSGGCVVDMRSKSRLGKGDFGQNAEHIRLFMGLFE